MINIEGQKIRFRNGRVYTVKNQSGNNVTLIGEDGNEQTCQYSVMFSSGSCTLLDGELHERVKADALALQNTEKEDKEKTEAEIKAKAEMRKINELLYSDVNKWNISCEYGNVKVAGYFEYKKMYGTVAKRIYEDGCEYLGFKRNKASIFDRQRLLYARECSPEGYSIWMIPHSDLNGETNSQWLNFIDILKGQIVQYSTEGNWYPGDTDDVRIVFVKQKDGEYVFIGVYQRQDVMDNYPEKGYRKEVFSLLEKDYR